jgi:hypothetical protein
MISLCIFFFAFFVYSIVQCIPSKKFINNSFDEEYEIEQTNNNVIILSKLNYYNVNTNASRTSFIVECMEYLLYSRNPNFMEEYTFCFDNFNMDSNSIEKLYTEFEILCTQLKKYKLDFTIGEITNFIKNSDIYKKLEVELNYKLKRSIVLSKFINDTTSDKLIDSLTLQELEILEAN